jgi:hypothetical protein
MHSSVYKNTEVKMQSGGGKIIRKVNIKNGKGYKSITKYRNGKKMKTVKKTIHPGHISMIVQGKFVPGLFSDCQCREKNKSRKNRK